MWLLARPEANPTSRSLAIEEWIDTGRYDLIERLLAMRSAQDRSGDIEQLLKHVPLRKGREWDSRLLSALIDSNAGLDMPFFSLSGTLLHEAMRDKQWEIVLQLLKARADPRVRDRRGNMPHQVGSEFHPARAVAAFVATHGLPSEGPGAKQAGVDALEAAWNSGSSRRFMEAATGLKLAFHGPEQDAVATLRYLAERLWPAFIAELYRNDGRVSNTAFPLTQYPGPAAHLPLKALEEWLERLHAVMTLEAPQWKMARHLALECLMDVRRMSSPLAPQAREIWLYLRQAPSQSVPPEDAARLRAKNPGRDLLFEKSALDKELAWLRVARNALPKARPSMLALFLDEAIAVTLLRMNREEESARIRIAAIKSHRDSEGGRFLAAIFLLGDPRVHIAFGSEQDAVASTLLQLIDPYSRADEPLLVRTRLVRARAMDVKGNSSEAKLLLERALKGIMESPNPDWRNGERALARLLSLISLPHDGNMLLRVSGRLEEVLDRAGPAAKDSPLPCILLAAYFADAGDIDRALRWASKADSDWSNIPKVRIAGLKELRAVREEAEQAERFIKAALALTRTYESIGHHAHAQRFASWGIQAVRARHEPQAVEAELLSLAPTTVDEWLAEFGDVHGAAEYATAAVSVLRKALQSEGDSLDLDGLEQPMTEALGRAIRYQLRAGRKDGIRDMLAQLARRPAKRAADRFTLLELQALASESASDPVTAARTWMVLLGSLPPAERRLRETSMNGVVRSLELQKKYGEALKAQQRLVAELLEGPVVSIRKVLDARLRTLRLATTAGDENSRLETFENMVNDIERARAGNVLSMEDRQVLFSKWVFVYREYAAELISRGRSDTAFEIAEMTKARTLLESTASRHATQSAGLTPEDRDSLETLEMAIALKTQQIASSAGAPEQQATLELERNRLTATLSAQREALRAKHPKYRQMSEVSLVKSREVPTLAADDEAIISYFASGDRMHAFVATTQGLRVQSWRLAPGLNESVESFRRLSAQTVDSARGMRPAADTQDASKVRQLARHLHAQLLKPIEPFISNKTIWRIVPDGALAVLPFELLEGPDGLVVNNRDIGYVQSVSLLKLLKERGRHYAIQPRPGTLFAIGGARYAQPLTAAASNPAAAGAKCSGGNCATTTDKPKAGARSVLSVTPPQIARGAAAAEQFRRLNVRWEDLPGSDAEVRSLVEMVGGNSESVRRQVTALYGEDATEWNLQRMNETGALRGFRWLHFAVHGYLSTESSALSALVLGQTELRGGTDGYVTTSEWFSYDLQSDLVVLSACETGLGEQIDGDAIMGVPFALFVAGNKDVLLTLWPVVDESTKVFMDGFYRRMLSGSRPVRALAETKREFAASEKYSRSVFWAGFVLHGD